MDEEGRGNLRSAPVSERGVKAKVNKVHSVDWLIESTEMGRTLRTSELEAYPGQSLPRKFRAYAHGQVRVPGKRSTKAIHPITS